MRMGLVSFRSSGGVFDTTSKCSLLWSSAAHHFRLAVWAVRTFGDSMARKCLVFYDELDLGDLGGVYEHVERRRPSAWRSNRRCRYYRNGVLYCV